jgi:MFS transporter, DHA1 family, multidrug resistance protein
MKHVLLLSWAIAVGQFANSMIVPALSLIARDLDVPPGKAGLIVTAYFFGFCVVGLLIGPLSDRTGRRRPLLAGIMVLAAGSIACSLAPTFAILLAFRVVEAAGAAGTPVLARAIVRDAQEGRELAAALGLLATAMSVSPVAGPILGGFLTDAIGWRWLFAIVSMMAICAAVAVYVAIPETLTKSSRHVTDNVWRQMRDLMRKPRFRHGVLYASAFYFTFGAIYTMAPFMLIDRFGLSHSQFGMAFAVMSACLAIGGIAGPRLISRSARFGLLHATAVLLVLAGVLMLGLVGMGDDTLATVILGLALFGLAFGVALSAGAAFTLDEIGRSAGAASSLSGFLQIGSATLGSAVANTLHSGSTMPLAVILMVSGFVAFIAILHMDETPV